MNREQVKDAMDKPSQTGKDWDEFKLKDNDLMTVRYDEQGAVPLDSRFYIERSTDREFHEAIERQDSLVLVKGARQVGKTSLLARGLNRARERGARVVLIDFQSLRQEYFESSEKLILSLAETLADQLDLDVYPSQMWNSFMSPGINFERFLRREVLVKIEAPIVWGLDEVDRLFNCDFGSDIFGLFRSWHNKRALDPEGPWKRLTQVIAYARPKRTCSSPT
jgi:hypothetical protein